MLTPLEIGMESLVKEGFVSLLSLSKSLGLVVESNSRKHSPNFRFSGVVLVQTIFTDPFS